MTEAAPFLLLQNSAALEAMFCAGTTILEGLILPDLEMYFFPSSRSNCHC